MFVKPNMSSLFFAAFSPASSAVFLGILVLGLTVLLPLLSERGWRFGRGESGGVVGGGETKRDDSRTASIAGRW